ncbi:MAG: hypothetical protein AAF799_32780 [Myxococcota bacterium]
MPRLPRFRSIALAAIVSTASCISITEMITFHDKDDALVLNSNVAVLENPTGDNLVIIAEGRDTIVVDDEDGHLPAPLSYALDFDIKVMAPGPNRELWALDTSHNVHRLRFASNGTLLSSDELFAVDESEDIAVASDGGSIYVIDDHQAHRYALNGLQLASVAINRAGAFPLPPSTQRIAVDHHTGFVYTAETDWVSYGGPWYKAVRVVRMNADLSSANATNSVFTDSRTHLVDFEIADGTRVWERSNGGSSGLLQIENSGEIRDEQVVHHISGMRAGSLSTAGVHTSFGPCGGSEGAYLWRSRTSLPVAMLERRTVCAD